MCVFVKYFDGRVQYFPLFDHVAAKIVGQHLLLLTGVLPHNITRFFCEQMSLHNYFTHFHMFLCCYNPNIIQHNYSYIQSYLS